jgi:uncharacterized membrane protein (UPF0127 family)
VLYRALPLLAIVLAACACEQKRAAGGDGTEENPPPRAQVSARVHITGSDGADHAVRVEVVRTEAEVHKGLMYRKHLDADGGMLFFMGVEEQQTFWMKNTYISLDMIFITSDMHVAGVSANTVPLSEELSFVDKPSLYVLEVNAGWAKANGVGEGARVSFENIRVP